MRFLGFSRNVIARRRSAGAAGPAFAASAPLTRAKKCDGRCRRQAARSKPRPIDSTGAFHVRGEERSPKRIACSAGPGGRDDWVGISYGDGATVLNTPHGVILPAP